MSGVSDNGPLNNRHLVRSNDDRVALSVGAIDDIWKFGKPRGTGGPWKHSDVKAGIPSDPYLLTGYDHKTLTLLTNSTDPIRLRVECDISGTGLWVPYREFDIRSNQAETHEFPAAF
jgi:hypothetical protein